jgi:hypothetical protein
MDSSLLELAHSLDMLAVGVEHRRGSRVESYDPLVKCVSDVMRGVTPHLPRQAASVATPEGAAVATSLVRLMAAILAGHAAVAGASAGPAVGTNVAAGWATLLPGAKLPHGTGVALARSLLSHHVPHGAMAALVPALAASLAPAAVRWDMPLAIFHSSGWASTVHP